MHLNPSLAVGLHIGDADQGTVPDESRHALVEIGHDAELIDTALEATTGRHPSLMSTQMLICKFDYNNGDRETIIVCRVTEVQAG
jgi:hypothetical protein